MSRHRPRRWFPLNVRALFSALIIGAATLTAVAVPAAAHATTVGNVTGFTGTGNSYTVTVGSAKVQITFARDDIFRLWLAPTGSFTNPAGSKLAVRTNFGTVNVTSTDNTSYYRLATSAVSLRVYKTPLRFELYRSDNSTLIWSETTGLTWDTAQTSQNLSRGADEQFYGAGLRLGQWALRDKVVPIAKDNRWNENDNASPAPFYLSTKGYGVMRNTWAPGQYDFGPGMTLRHNEVRFDAYYFVGDSLKNVIGDYTDVTGKPFLAPIWGLELGNADCWSTYNTDPEQGPVNRAGHLQTPDVVAYARDARDKDMPSGWFLPNDGYGCNYEDLTSTVTSLRNLGFQTGLWTSTGLANIATEVGVSGSRAVKTDVAWIGGGYEYAFDGVQQAVDGIENNSNARRFVWTVDGWAGTQRNAVVWTGDTSGTWADMKWHVPAIAGAGFSGLNYASGDVDGIYAGSPQTYVRDLQWKAFTPAFMTMSGWGATNPSAGYNDKQPWRYTDPYLSINRKYLQLKMRLTPYFYTLARNATDTGVPTVRTMALEFEGDTTARGNLTSQQFMAGGAFLVAPVTSDTTTRDDIYLPAGTWTDYWTGATWTGPGWIDGYNAPQDTLPLLVRGGSIVPMWPQMNYAGQTPATPITFDVYPRGTSSFTLYEDDGVTRAYQTGSSARQTVNVTAPASGTGNVTISVGASVGSFTGKLANRGYAATVHVAQSPTTVAVDGTALTRHTTRAAYNSAATGWFFDPSEKAGTLNVKTGSKSTGAAFTITATGVTLANGATPTGTAPVERNISKASWTVSADSQETAMENGAAVNAIDGNPDTIWHSKWSSPAAPLPHDLVVDMGATYPVDGIDYLPRQTGTNGNIGQYEIYVSTSTSSWGNPVATGTFADTQAEKHVPFTPKNGRYLRLRALTEAGNNGPWTSAAEIGATAFVGNPTGTLVHEASGRCNDIPGSNTAPGTQVALWSCHGGPNQTWTFQGNGTVTGLSGVCLDSNGANVVVDSCAGAMTWIRQANGAITATNGQCLGTQGNGTANGTVLVLAACSGTAAQHWNVV
jgi:alpha-glucosidase